MSGPNFLEYSVDKKIEGWHLAKRLLLILGYILFVILLFVGIYLSNFIPVGALLPLFTWILVFFTWRYVCVEYEYTLASGQLTVAKIYGNRTRRVLLEVRLSDMTLIAPLNKSFSGQIERANPAKTYDALSSKKSPNAYFALFPDKNGKVAILYFDACNKFVSLAKFYNSAATVLSDKLTF